MPRAVKKSYFQQGFELKASSRPNLGSVENEPRRIAGSSQSTASRAGRDAVLRNLHSWINAGGRLGAQDQYVLSPIASPNTDVFQQLRIIFRLSPQSKGHWP